MIDHKGTAVNFLILFLLCMECNIQSVSGGGDIGELRCMEREREALLRFKEGLIDEHGVLSSWGSENDNKECCKWKGVRCSNITGHVIALKLRSDFSPVYSFVHRLKGKITSALIDLHDLNELDLSGNDFGGNSIPGFIGSMKKLEHLNFYSCNISGIIPPQLGNLTSLRTLDLSFNSLRSENLNWLSGLSLLSLLDLSYVKLNGTNLFEQIPKLRSLQELNLRNCNIADVTPSARLFVNFSTISVLELSYNDLTSSTIDWLFNTSLFRTYPRSLWLFGNKLNRLPPNLGQLSKLERLYVSFNSLEGTISEANFEKLHNLKALDLSYNRLTLDFSPDWIPPFQLSELALARSNIGPRFPKWIQTQINLTWLDLSWNCISDEVPKWLGSLSPSLQYLNLSQNQISGTIQHFSSHSIYILDVSFNKISGSIPLFSPYTSYIRLSTNKFSGSISSICTRHQLQYLTFLDLSNNQLGGELPTCWENMELLLYLDLANNSFSGPIPHALGSLLNLKILQLHDNNLSGQLPLTLKNCRNLQMIDIGRNKLTGDIPVWIGASYTSLTYLILGHNRVYGNIPPEICNLTRIQVLDLSENNISGDIPQCFNDFISLVEKNTTIPPLRTIHFLTTIPDFGIFYFFVSVSGHVYPAWYTEYALVQWKGRESEYRKNLQLLKLIDLSSNRLVGSIPRSFSRMRGLISLNLSRNSLTGNIIPDIDQMEMLECLDLSRNHLSGEIPTGLAQLHFLAILDLAYNNLSGKIPSSTQLQSFNVSAYAGNNNLCGTPIKLCPENVLSPSTTNEGDKIKEKDDGFMSLSFMQEFGIAMAFGFIVGFWGVIGSLLLKKSWRSAYFNFLDAAEDWLYVNTTVFFNKFRRN